MIMKDFDLTRQNWQWAKVQAECVLPSPEINMRCETGGGITGVATICERTLDLPLLFYNPVGSLCCTGGTKRLGYEMTWVRNDRHSRVCTSWWGK